MCLGLIDLQLDLLILTLPLCLWYAQIIDVSLQVVDNHFRSAQFVLMVLLLVEQELHGGHHGH